MGTPITNLTQYNKCPVLPNLKILTKLFWKIYSRLADEVSTKNTLKELTGTEIVKQSAPLWLIIA